MEELKTTPQYYYFIHGERRRITIDPFPYNIIYNIMSLPFFYITGYDPSKKEIVLDEAVSRHLVQVLRMKPGELLNLTDGKGNLLTASIIEDHNKHSVVKVQQTSFRQQATRKISIAISLLKNDSRFEWFLEKATEIGVNEIIPLLCERTEKKKFGVTGCKVF